jgi:hypothetical protein
VEGTTVFTGESPDVVAHELGHAVLDAIRPQLWDAMSHEVAAVHEAFGDVSAILTALQLPSVRDHVIAETGGLYRTSRLSRVAEQLGWAVRTRKPCSVDGDSLRNAVNCFAYQPPSQLPMTGPSCVLTSEPYSYSRVFTAGFFETLVGMALTRSRPPTADTLLEVATDAGRLVVAAARAAPVTAAYMSEVAAHVLEADQRLFGGRYAAAIENGFLRRAILSTAGLRMTGDLGLRVAAAAPAAPGELPAIVVSGEEFGLGDRAVVLRVAGEQRRLAVAPAGLDAAPARTPSGEEAARGLLAELLVRDKVRLPGRDPTDRVQPHELVEEGRALVMRRQLFDAGGGRTDEGDQGDGDEEARFIEGLVARGEAAEAVDGELPEGATHEIVVDEHGRRTVRRRRFTTGPE